ncbi:MAG: hypothetical protein IJX19_11490 [Clostridia bacterium]|nr:hypothetical protein [Clostridia bacterium]
MDAFFERFKKKPKKNTFITASQMIAYGVLLFVSNVIATNLATILNRICLTPLMGKVPFAVLGTVLIIGYILINLGLPYLAFSIYFRTAVPAQYTPGGSRFDWLKKCLLLVAPAEILRYLLCIGTLGIMVKSGYYAMLPTCIFEWTYVRWSGRKIEIRQLGQFIAADYLAYTASYLIYSIVNLFFLALIYRHFWLKGKKDREDLVVYDRQLKFH